MQSSSIQEALEQAVADRPFQGRDQFFWQEDIGYYVVYLAWKGIRGCSSERRVLGCFSQTNLLLDLS